MQLGNAMIQECSLSPASARVKRWRQANPEKYREQQRRYAERHPDILLAKDRRWKDAHREQSRRSVRDGRRRKRAFLAEVVGAACVDCGDDRPGAVEYHHPGGKDKGQVPLTHLSWDRLREGSPSSHRPVRSLSRRPSSRGGLICAIAIHTLIVGR